jgi:hypothetical protein
VRIEELEGAVAEHFDAEHLAVYADFLQGVGDPRGELIALDLAGEAVAADRRHELAIAWLGKLLPFVEVGAIDCGFIGDVVVSEQDPRGPVLLELLAIEPAARHLRGLTITGRRLWVAATLARIVAQPQRWLERLSIHVWDNQRPPIPPAVDRELATALAIATPSLARLEVVGRNVFDELPHTHIRSLRLTGYDAVSSIIGEGFPLLPSVELLDLEFAPMREPELVARELAPRFRPGRLPALRRLDVSRNEPEVSELIDAFDFVARSPLRRQLTHVRLPSMRSERQAQTLAELAAGRSIALARGYQMWSQLPLPNSVPMPTMFPWPPVSSMTVTNFVFSIRRDDEDPAIVNRPFAVSLPPLVRWLEARFDSLPLRLRAGWLALYAGLDTGVTYGRIDCLAGTLPYDDPDLARWEDMLEAITQLGAHRMTTIMFDER